MARFLQLLGVGLGLTLSVGIGIGAGCSAGGNRLTGAGGSGGGGDTGGSGNSGNSGQSSSSNGAGGFNMGDAGLPACATFSAKAQQAPAVMLTVLDASASMNKQSKWGTALLAIKTAIDKDIFDTMSLGLTIFPASYVDPPACLCQGLDIQTCKAFLGAPGVSCGVSFLPQVPIAPAGTDKTNAAMGVRRQMYDWLVGHNPLSNADDGSPIYDALKSGYETLKAESIDRRILVLITDGGFSCTSVASPARGAYQDLNGCPDWEYPASVNTLIAGAQKDPSTPIDTFVIGVPGSNSTGQKDGAFDTAPYNMLLALSTYAVSGSPDTVDPSCSKDAMFTQGGAAPAKPCHLDLSTGPFDANVLATAISKIRGAALGCVYDLPPPPMGQTIDKATVNVNVTIADKTATLPKRQDPLDLCTVDGCWDYTADDKVRIYGKTCEDLSNATAGKVDIYVGCETILK